MQDLNNMLYFAQVVDHGSFAATARELGIPTSTLSRRVADLEAVLGVRLLQRTTRKLSLTEIGEVYYQHCVSLRAQAQAAEDAVAVAQSEPRGTIKMSCPISLAQITMRPILPEFMRRYPKVKIEMLVSNEAFDPVQAGLDLALRVRPTLDDSGSMVVKQFGVVRTQLLATPHLLTENGQPQSPENLKRVPSVAMSVTDGRATLRLLGPNDQTFELQHRPCFAADDLLTLKHVVLGGIGMGILPEYLCRQELDDGQLVKVLPDWAPLPDVLHAVFPSRRGMVPAVRCFLDFLDAYAQEGIRRIRSA
jgi:DNA-binding transcriptional LysR family regulator